MCKGYGSTTGTSLHEHTNLLEYDFGTTDGFKKKLLKWENQIGYFQKATGEVFSDRLKCAIVLSRSPGPIRTNLRVQNRGDYTALRMALMDHLEAEDDGHGPVPVEVGAMKGKKGDKGKNGHGKGKYGKSFGKYDKNNEYSKNNEYGKGSEKGKEKRKKGKGIGQGKDEKPAPNSSFQGYCRSCGKWGHKASECWQGYVQAVEEVPSSSASSVAPSAATTPAAAKTAASTQEINDENAPGWIFGVTGESVASVTTGTDDLWDELVLDSGSVSTGCPYAWCSDISVNDGDRCTCKTFSNAESHRMGQEWCLLSCRVRKDVLNVKSSLM